MRELFVFCAISFCMHSHDASLCFMIPPNAMEFWTSSCRAVHTWAALMYSAIYPPLDIHTPHASTYAT
jgi:hypothetical protein